MPKNVPINPLIEHLWRTNREQILAQSRMNCHAHNVHSIMLLNSPGRTIRLFVALPGHELWKNQAWYVRQGEDMSVGFHPHHCELTLQTVIGAIQNWVIEPGDDFKLTEFKYQSYLRNGLGGFERLGPVSMSTYSSRIYFAGESVYLPANAIHTIACSRSKLAAWLVFEGREDSDYTARCYSTSNLEDVQLEEMYQPASEDQIEELLRLVKLIN